MIDFYKFVEEKLPLIEKLAQKAQDSTIIEQEYYEKYDVKRGLRDINGNGVVVGLTEISEIQSSIIENGVKVPCKGVLRYRGIDINDLVNGVMKDNRFGFEEISYLLLFGNLPTTQELSGYNDILQGMRKLPDSFVRDIIMKAPSTDMMNTLSRSVLTLYSYDDNADDVRIANVLKQCLQLIAQFPIISVYGYQVYNHYHDFKSLIIHQPLEGGSTAENILHLLREDTCFTPLEAKVLDLCLMLHAEHGGGNNSTFTTHVVSSSGTDTYSAISASLGSLKGPKHGGANIKVAKMFEDMRKTLTVINDETVSQYLCDLLDKKAFDKSGLIYGMGHAVYSLSDPRADILKGFVELLAKEKGMEEEYELYKRVEILAPQIIADRRKIYKGVSVNIDFYSGLVYSMLNLPTELMTPIFAIARIVGWSAHRIEEISNNGKIIRPGYISVASHRDYTPITER